MTEIISSSFESSENKSLTPLVDDYLRRYELSEQKVEVLKSDGEKLFQHVLAFNVLTHRLYLEISRGNNFYFRDFNRLENVLQRLIFYTDFQIEKRTLERHHNMYLKNLLLDSQIRMSVMKNFVSKKALLSLNTQLAISQLNDEDKENTVNDIEKKNLNIEYRVRPGDNLWTIVKNTLGLNSNRDIANYLKKNKQFIVEKNNLKNIHTIYPGMILHLPKK